MSNEPVFIAIGIACVVAVLLFIVFIIYCFKKHQDKEETRLRRERERDRMAREERHRRHMMRSNVVRPPPYDPNRQGMFPYNSGEIPMTPPPEYKEVATPVPRNRNAVGIGGVVYPPPTFGHAPDSDYIPTISRNVAPVNTIYGNNYFSTAQPSYGNPSYSNGYRNNSNNNHNINNNNSSNNDENLANTNSRSNDNTLQVRSLSREAPTEVIVPPSVSLDDGHRNGRPSNYDANRNGGPTSYSNNMNNRQGGGVISTYQVQSNDRAPNYNATNSTNRNDRTSFDSINRSEDRGQGYNANSAQHEGLTNRGSVYNGRRHSNNAINYGYGGSYLGNSLTRPDGNGNVNNASSGPAAQVHNPYSYYTRGQNSVQRGAHQYGTNDPSPTVVGDLSLI